MWVQYSPDLISAHPVHLQEPVVTAWPGNTVQVRAVSIQFQDTRRKRLLQRGNRVLSLGFAASMFVQASARGILGIDVLEWGCMCGKVRRRCLFWVSKMSC